MILSVSLYPIKYIQDVQILHKDICAVINAQFGGVEDHVIVVHIAPGFSGVLIIICGTLFVGIFDLFLRCLAVE